jgi:hypothetical protein
MAFTFCLKQLFLSSVRFQGFLFASACGLFGNFLAFEKDRSQKMCFFVNIFFHISSLQLFSYGGFSATNESYRFMCFMEYSPTVPCFVRPKTAKLHIPIPSPPTALQKKPQQHA